MSQTPAAAGSSGLKELRDGLGMSDSVSLPSYADYPLDRPFLNSHRHLPSNKPIKAYPESSSAAILSALKNLQEKIRRLERERAEAEENLRRLSKETVRYSRTLETERDAARNRELAEQLSVAESRCHLLEKQLEYMRKMVRNAESERTAVLKEQVSLEKEKSADHVEVQAKLEKLDLLEKEYLKLTKTQNLAESKIQQLEQKLCEEEHQRKLVQDKAAQLQTGLEANRILLQSVSPLPAKTSKSKKARQSAKKPLRQHQSHPQPHYRLRLGDVPFVAGTVRLLRSPPNGRVVSETLGTTRFLPVQSTGTSHSVRANVQHVLHLMKQHNRQLCNDRVLSETPLAARSPRATAASRRSSSTSGSSSSSCCSEELSELLLALQDEFGQMSFEHQELVKQIQESRSDRLRQDLERELEALVKRMESKGDQIAKVRRHQMQVAKLKKESRQGRRAGEVKVTTTVTTRGRAAGPVKAKPGDRSKDSLRLLRDMQSLQTSLRNEQISWDH
ncbi:centrosomal protein of 57 kDa isoform X1 [Arapaima gigas]